MKIEVRLDEGAFFRFSRFDVLRRRRLWRSPAVFAAILCASAALCFVMHRVRGAVALGVVLLAAGVGIPAAYFLNFFLSLRAQAREQGLAGGKHVYTVRLTGDGGISVDNGREQAAFSWGQVFHAYRDGDAAIYLYITPQRAFLIPGGCVKGGLDEAWRLMEENLPAERQTVL